jgi:hypothetical protein
MTIRVHPITKQIASTHCAVTVNWACSGFPVVLLSAELIWAAFPVVSSRSLLSTPDGTGTFVNKTGFSVGGGILVSTTDLVSIWGDCVVTG